MKEKIMSDKTTKSLLNRRTFFAGAAALTGAAVVLSKTPKGQKIVAEVEQFIEPENKSGYQVTEHVKKYYETTRT